MKMVVVFRLNTGIVGRSLLANNFFFLLLLKCQFTIYLTVQEVISKCDVCICLEGGNFPAEVLNHLVD
jgi:hypothetical protein